jgi:hypothetical protein
MWGWCCCTYGHALIWQRLKDSPGWHLIIEDDAKPLPGILHAYQIAAQSDNYDLIKLHHYVEGEGTHRVEFVGLDNWVSTTAYIVRDTAKLLKRLRCDPIDRQLQEIADVGVLVPRCVDSARETGHESTIDYGLL